ncbi:MAG: DegT/DnrJ/EryC1/StrS family aminotransferase, partial [bacterium]
MKDLDPKEIVGAEELANVTAVINSGNMWRMGGLFVDRFEDEMAAHLGRKYVYAVNSGTSANEAIVAGLGLEPGDEVICPSSTPIFATMPVFAASGIPVFADSDPRTTMITPEGIEAVVSKRSKAIFVVHAFGQVAPMDKIMAMAKKHNLKVLEDCAQAYDCYFEDKMTGAIGDSSCFSMQQSKHITSGEGGFVSTDDPEMYKKMVLY